MAAPTPVSSLVHSRTLVTAGVYLVIRFRIINSVKTNITIAIIFLLTRAAAGIIAITEKDLKKTIAISTLRQLGIIFFTAIIKLPSLAFFHLCTHATFKALLFVNCGITIRIISGNQDRRQATFTKRNNAIPSETIKISGIRLIGFPFIAGFYSKDLILEKSNFFSAIRTTILLTISCITTIIYTRKILPENFFFLEERFTIIISEKNNAYLTATTIAAPLPTIIGAARF